MSEDLTRAEEKFKKRMSQKKPAGKDTAEWEKERQFIEAANKALKDRLETQQEAKNSKDRIMDGATQRLQQLTAQFEKISAAFDSAGDKTGELRDAMLQINKTIGEIDDYTSLVADKTAGIMGNAEAKLAEEMKKARTVRKKIKKKTIRPRRPTGRPEITEFEFYVQQNGMLDLNRLPEFERLNGGLPVSPRSVGIGDKITISITGWPDKDLYQLAFWLRRQGFLKDYTDIFPKDLRSRILRAKRDGIGNERQRRQRMDELLSEADAISSRGRRSKANDVGIIKPDQELEPAPEPGKKINRALDF